MTNHVTFRFTEKSRKNSQEGELKKVQKDSRKKKKKKHTVTIWCVGEHRKLVFCTAPRVSHRRSLSPLLAIFITLFLLDLSPLPTPSSLRPYSILDCALSPFVHALLNEGHVFRHVSAPTRLYIHLLLLYFYNYDDCSVHGYTDEKGSSLWGGLLLARSFS